MLSVAGGDLWRRGDGDREGGERFRFPEGPGEYCLPGGGVGSLTADWSTVASAMAPQKIRGYYKKPDREQTEMLSDLKL